MKRRIISAAAAALICFCTVVTPRAEIGEITGEERRKSEELTLSDGTKTGVVWSEIYLNGYYGNDRVINIAEFSLSNTRLSVEVINCGEYMVSARGISSACSDYNNANEGQTVLAAVNGDLYMTSVHSGAGVTKKVLKVPRGVLIIDGEIWATQQIDEENLGATNNEKGQGAGAKAAFGVTGENQALVGSPDIKVEISANGKVLEAGGINRLPAEESLIVYNRRVNSTNYALNDAYEVELEAEGSSAFGVGGTVKATVKAVYPAGSENRPSLSGEKTVVLTARGSKTKVLEENFNIGDSVEIKTTLTDRMGRTELWQNVQDAIGGHMEVLIDGEGGAFAEKTAYPTTLIGYKDDGSIAMVTVTSAKEKSRAALRISQAYELCGELGYNSVFYLDGGGSTTFVTLEEGSYTVRNNCSDGSQRSVINGIGVVWNEDPVCEKQGDLGYIKSPADLSGVSPTYINGEMLCEVTRDANNVSVSYSEEEGAFCMEVTGYTNDPFITLYYSRFARVKAEEYPVIVLKVKSDFPERSNFALYYSCGEDYAASAERVKVEEVGVSEGWQYIIADMSGEEYWRGNINNIRLDIFDSIYTDAGSRMYIEGISLCKSVEEAEKLAGKNEESEESSGAESEESVPESSEESSGDSEESSTVPEESGKDAKNTLLTVLVVLLVLSVAGAAVMAGKSPKNKE